MLARLLVSDDNERHTLETCCKGSSRALKRHIA